MSAQKSFEFRTHGGKRAGAGRPPRGPRSSEKHKTRPPIDARHPLHVVIRARPGLRLRRRAGWQAVRHGLAIAARRSDFRICHVSVQATHIHLIVEADDHQSLARGMQGFQVACARRFNRHSLRRGGVFADRYHPRALASLREVRNGLAYVLNNWRRHREDLHDRRAYDPYASARAFDGWAHDPRRSHLEFVPVVMATTWHLTHGWRRYGPIDPHVRPGRSSPHSDTGSRATRTRGRPSYSMGDVRGPRSAGSSLSPSCDRVASPSRAPSCATVSSPVSRLVSRLVSRPASLPVSGPS